MDDPSDASSLTCWTDFVHLSLLETLISKMENWVCRVNVYDRINSFIHFSRLATQVGQASHKPWRKNCLAYFPFTCVCLLDAFISYARVQLYDEPIFIYDPWNAAWLHSLWPECEAAVWPLWACWAQTTRDAWALVAPGRNVLGPDAGLVLGSIHEGRHADATRCSSPGEGGKGKW